MSKKSQYRAQSRPCAYCGAPSSTRDHVVPRSIFNGHMTNLITVRSCFNCNQAKGAYDTLLRDFLAVDARARHHQASRQNFDGPFMRSARRGQSYLAKRIIADSKPAELVTKAGLLVWQGIKVDLREDEIDESLRYIVRGLTYRQLGERVRSDAIIETSMLYPQGAQITWDIMCTAGAINGPWVLGDEVFRWAFVHAGPNAAIWLIVFYGGIFCVVFVQPPGWMESLEGLTREADEAA